MTLAIVHNWLSSCGALTVPGELNGVSAVAQTEGEILHQEKRLKQARILGENVLQVAAKLVSELGVGGMTDETRNHTNPCVDRQPPKTGEHRHHGR